MESLVRLYFEAGYKYYVILMFLVKFHGYSISMRTLKRILHRMGLRRNGTATTCDFRAVARCIQVLLKVDI